MASLALVIVIFVSLLGLSDGQCSMSEPVTNTSSYGTVETACQYKNLRFLPGSTFELGVPNCVKCSCTANGLQCCGTKAVAQVTGNECRVIYDFCATRMVDKKDPKKACKPTNSDTVMSMVL